MKPEQCVVGTRVAIKRGGKRIMVGNIMPCPERLIIEEGRIVIEYDAKNGYALAWPEELRKIKARKPLRSWWVNEEFMKTKHDEEIRGWEYWFGDKNAACIRTDKPVDTYGWILIVEKRVK